MSRPTVDTRLLAVALDKKRQQEAISWRELARRFDLSPSTLTRLRNGQAPDTGTLLVLTRWVGMRVEDFAVRDRATEEQEPDLIAQLVPLFRARADLDETDAEMLETIVEAAYRQIKARKDSG